MSGITSTTASCLQDSTQDNVIIRFGFGNVGVEKNYIWQLYIFSFPCSFSFLHVLYYQVYVVEHYD